MDDKIKKLPLTKVLLQVGRTEAVFRQFQLLSAVVRA